MLHPPISPGQPRTSEPSTDEPADRSMDVLQYATAFLAIVVVVLLAVLR
jgi:hypothetical protein